MSKLSKKQRHQVKSRWYYIFWGTATLSVFAGQMYVGTGYRKMAESVDNVLKSPIVIEEMPFRHPMMVPDHWEEPIMHPTDPPMRVY